MRLGLASCCAALHLLLVGIVPALAGEEGADPGRAREAVDKGLDFLVADAAKWREERKCATCHHGTMTVWALGEARSQGYGVSPETLADVTAWTKERLANIDKPRDTRPGYNMVSTPAVYLAVMALAVPGQTAVSPDELGRIADHLVRHQEEDGSWAWSLGPAKNLPPPVFESDEVVSLLAYLALGPDTKPSGRAARERVAGWLGKAKQGGSTQATAIRLYRDVREGKPSRELDGLLRLQREDGGWGQEAGLPSDAYATGQALYFLNLAGVARDREEVRRGVGFLVKTQRPDGSWPMRSRSHPGAEPMKNPVPITYFGSAWATIGLIRSVQAGP